MQLFSPPPFLCANQNQNSKACTMRLKAHLTYLFSTSLLIIVVNGKEECKESSGKKREYFVSNEADVSELLEDLAISIKGIKKSCGEICITEEGQERFRDASGVWSRELEKEVNCQALMSNGDMDANGKFPTPRLKIPKFLMQDYSYQGRVEIEYEVHDTIYHVDDDGNYGGSDNQVNDDEDMWSERGIEDMVDKLRSGDYMTGMYTDKDAQNLDEHLKNETISGGVKGKTALVIGSQVPWIESLLLLNGAAHVTTLEYHTIKSTHPKVTTALPQELSTKFLEGTLEPFDLIVSFSSLEHSGLGRYGDQLNPFGDLITMARTWCMTIPGGRAIIGIPYARKDKVVFNLHRIYSGVMLPHLFANWKQIHSDTKVEDINPDCDWCYQPLFVMKKAL